MVKHVVMWKVGGRGEEKEQRISLIVEKLFGLREKISAIISIEAGKNFSVSSNAYDIALVVTVENVGKLNEYRNHPEHKKVAELIGNLTTSVVVVDFESI